MKSSRGVPIVAKCHAMLLATCDLHDLALFKPRNPSCQFHRWSETKPAPSAAPSPCSLSLYEFSDRVVGASNFSETFNDRSY